MSGAAIVAIDGPAGSGKSTVARRVAKDLGYVYVDTGAIYRALALVAQHGHIDLQDGEALGQLALHLNIGLEDHGQRIRVDGDDVSEAIRQPEISMNASRVSAHPEVRAALLDVQRRLARDGGHPGAVLEGRDIGTVVFPQAGLKIFINASIEERARRRHAELRQRGESDSVEQVIDDMRQRDHNDSHRAAAPLRRADDAIEVDTTGLSIEAVVARVVELARQRYF